LGKEAAAMVTRLQADRDHKAARNAPIPRVRRRYYYIYMQGKNTLAYIC